MIKSTLLMALISVSTAISQEFVVENDMRLKEGDPYYQHIDVTYNHKISEHFTPFVGYRFINENKKKWEHFSRFHTGFHLTAKVGPSKVAARSRLEYTPDWNLKSDDLTFRERVKISPFTVGQTVKYSPYVFDEVFFGVSNRAGYNRDRLGVGLDIKFNNSVSLEPYYFAEFRESLHWKSANIFGLIMKVKF